MTRRRGASAYLLFDDDWPRNARVVTLTGAEVGVGFSWAGFLAALGLLTADATALIYERDATGLPVFVDAQAIAEFLRAALGMTTEGAETRVDSRDATGGAVTVDGSPPPMQRDATSGGLSSDGNLGARTTRAGGAITEDATDNADLRGVV
jgi:hypothetical protein